MLQDVWLEVSDHTIMVIQVIKTFYSLLITVLAKRVSQVALVVKNLPANAGDIRGMGSIPGSRRPPGGGHGNLLQFLPGDSQGQRSLVGHSPQGRKSQARLKRCHRTLADSGIASQWISPRNPSGVFMKGRR